MFRDLTHCRLIILDSGKRIPGLDGKLINVVNKVMNRVLDHQTQYMLPNFKTVFLYIPLCKDPVAVSLYHFMNDLSISLRETEISLCDD